MSHLTSAARWARLADDLAAAGVAVKVDERTYSEAVYGRVQHGVSRSIVIRRADGSHVEIRDAWWRKNPDVWIGWVVSLAGRDDIDVRHWRSTKRRGEVVAAVREGMQR